VASNKINIVISAEDKASKPLRAVSDEMDHGSGTADKYNGALASMGATLGRTTLALGAAGIAAAGAGAAIGFKFNSSVEQAETKLMAFMKDGELVAKTLAWVKEEAAATQFSFTDMADAAANLTPVAKTSGQSLESLVKQAEVLAALNPTEGLTGATFALREALSGDWVSIVDRFNLPRKRINELKEQGVPAMEIISRTMQEMGIDYGLVAKQGQTVAAQWDQTKDKLTMMAGAASKPIFDRVKEGLGELGTFDYKGLEQNLTGVVNGSLKFFDSVVAIGTQVMKFLRPATDGLGDAIKHDLLPAFKAVASSDIVRYLGGALVVAVYAAIRVLEGVVRVVGSAASQFSAMTPILVALTAGFVAYNVIVGGLTAKTIAMTAAQTALNTAMRLNPLALVAGAAFGIIAAYTQVVLTSDRTTISTDALKGAQDRLTATTNAAKDAQDRLSGAYVGQEGAALAVERAQRTYNDAVAQYGPKSLEAREAAHHLKRANDDLAAAAAAVRDRTNEAKEAERQKKEAAAEVVKAHEAVKESAYRAAGGYAALRDRINEAKEADKKAGNVGASGPKQTNAVFGLKNATGTTYSPGGRTLVGEHGPEYVDMPRGAQVTPAYRSREQDMGRGGHTVVIQNMNVNNGENPRRIFEEIGFALELAS
jgi:hypothetical protein